MTGRAPWFADPCRCIEKCGDSDPDGPGVCKGLPRAPESPLVEIVLVPRSKAAHRQKEQPCRFGS